MASLPEPIELPSNAPDAATFPVYSWNDNGTPRLPKWRDLSQGSKFDPYDYAEPHSFVGYGVRTGLEFGLFVLDLDRKDGHDGVAWLEAELERRGEPWPETFEIATPSGGRHLYFSALPGDPCPTEAGGIAPGVDTRGNGGIVWGAGSTYKQPGKPTYRVIRGGRAAPMPRWLHKLLAPLSGPSRATTGLPDPRAPEGRRKTPDDLAASLKGQRSPYAGFWRDVCKGVEPIRDRAPGGWNDYLLRATQYLAGLDDWAEVEGEAVVQLMGPSLSHMKARREAEGKDWDSVSERRIADMFDGAAEKVRRDADFARGVIEELEEKKLEMQEARASGTEGNVARVAVYRNSFFVRQPDDSWKGPFTEKEFTPQCKQAGLPTVIPNGRTGATRILSSREIVDSLGFAVDDVRMDMGRDDAAIEGRVLWLGPKFEREPAEPQEHAGVQAWLDALDPSGAVTKWIAHADRRWLAETMPVLALVGPGGIGKNLIADGLAATHRMSGAHDGEMLFSDFQGTIESGFVFHAEEQGFRDSRGRPRTRELRKLTTKAELVVNQKHVAEFKISGAPRLVMTGNSPGALFPDRMNLTAADIDALEQRVTLIEIPKERQTAIQETVEALGALRSEKISRVAEHFAWLQARHEEMPRHPGRQLLPARPNRLGAHLRGQMAGLDELADALDRRAADGSGARGVYPGEGGRVFVRVQELSGGDRALEKDWRALLVGLCDGRKGARPPRGLFPGGGRPKVVDADGSLLAGLLDVEPADLL